MTTERQKALRFVVSLGIVSLFADFTYEGGRSILGSFLATLGTSAVVAGGIAGLGEFLGYAIRLGTGRYVDRSHRHWLVMGLGYGINVLSIPLLAFVPNAWVASVLVFTERLGKGARVPARDALLSHAGHVLGHGRAFGLHEFLDQVGALAGPLVVSAAVAYSGYRLGFGVLVVPALLALLFLWRARGLNAEHGQADHGSGRGHFDARYFVYLAFSVVAILGFSHFVLIAYHLEHAHKLRPAEIPLLFALAMATDAVAALVTGWLYDRIGLKVLVALPLLTVPAVALLFLASEPWQVWLGGALWGLAFGVQESTVRAGVATLTPKAIRGFAYGVFDSCFGLSWLLGSLFLGWLYSISPQALVIAALIFQVASLPLLFITLGMKTAKHT